MEQESLLKRIYEELKVQFSTEKNNKDTELDEEKIYDESMNELIEEYEKEYKGLQDKLRELRKQDIKEAQREQLAKYCKVNYGIKISTNKEKQNVADKEKEIGQQLEEKKTDFRYINGEI